MNKAKSVKLYVHGVCDGLRAPGSWGAILVSGDEQKEMSDSEELSTLNRMEMLGLLKGLKALKRPCNLEIYAASDYLTNGCCDWLPSWRSRAWTTTSGQPVKNADLWEAIDHQLSLHRVIFKTLKPDNPSTLERRAKKLANKAMSAFQHGTKARRRAARLDQEGKPVTQIYTDGSCRQHVAGGWGAVIIKNGQQEDISGWAVDATSNQMELLGTISALKTLAPGESALITVDSKYVKNGIQSWIENWKQNGWRTTENTPVKNVDLWKQLDALCAERSVSWLWTKSHNGNKHNEQADTLARDASAHCLRLIKLGKSTDLGGPIPPKQSLKYSSLDFALG